MTTNRAKAIPQTAARDIANRLDNGEDEAVATIASLGDLSTADAEAVFYAFRKHRLIQRDFITGRYSPRHGSFYEPETLRNAARNLAEGRV